MHIQKENGDITTTQPYLNSYLCTLTKNYVGGTQNECRVAGVGHIVALLY